MSFLFFAPRQGFLAITTAIILSLVLLTVALSMGSLGALTRTSGVDALNKHVGAALARSCVDYALLQLVQNSNYAGNETRAIDTNNCTILPIEQSGQYKIIKAQAILKTLTTNLRATVQITPFQILSLEEVASF